MVRHYHYDGDKRDDKMQTGCLLLVGFLFVYLLLSGCH
jgi:hypothetical protein